MKYRNEVSYNFYVQPIYIIYIYVHHIHMICITAIYPSTFNNVHFVEEDSVL